MYKSTKKTFCYYFIFSYTDKTDGQDKQISFVSEKNTYFPFKHALETCYQKTKHRGIITFFTRITQEEHTEYLSYVDSL